MKDIITAPHPTISIPFIQFNDQTRIQMASSQARQAVPLIESDPPMVETTLERSDILEPDIIRAKKKCVVVFSSTRLIVVRNEDGEYDIHRISYHYKIPEEGKEFDVGDVISYKLGFFDEKGNLTQGKNLLCAIISEPWCYEDSIVIGEHVNLTSYKYTVIEEHIPVSSILLSLDKNRYKILPEIGEKIKAFQPILLIKENDPTRIIEDPKEIYINEDSEVIEVEVVANRWNTDVREYDVAILEFLQSKEKLIKKLDKVIDDDYVKNEIKRYHNLYEYSKLTQKSSKKSPIKYGKSPFDLYVRIVLRSKHKIEVGDKVSNRHANKGVTSLITPNTPITSDGRNVDIITDLMSIISRMNIGQIYEIIASSCLYYLHKKVQEYNDIDEAKQFIQKFYDTIDCTEEKWISKHVSNVLNQINTLNELKELKLTFPAPPFESTGPKELLKACIHINPSIADNIDAYTKQHELKDLPDLSPLLEIIEYNGKKFYATCGYLYFYKLVHMASEKISARGTGKVMKKTLQPTAGRRNQGGQRFGEMEIWCLLAYDALFNIEEIVRLKSDDIQQKVMHLMKKLYDSDFSVKKEEIEVVKLFKAYLKILRTELKEGD